MTAVTPSHAMAGFVKLHRSMLNSTIWFSRPDREVFITALLLAEPREIVEPLPQLEVDSLNRTGWEVPPGWYGYCFAAGPGLLHQAGVPSDEGLAALRRLGEPEPESRSQDFEGRRLVRVDGGFLVLNYDKYRERDTTAAERARRYRDRKRRDARSSHREPSRRTDDVTQVEDRRQKTEEDQESPPVVPPEGGAKPKRRRAQREPRRARFCPEGFEPTEAHWTTAREVGADLQAELVKFREHEFDKPKSDWSRAFHAWLRRSVEFAGKGAGPAKSEKERLLEEMALGY